jgi:trk system potassium uptake protein TrkA
VRVLIIGGGKVGGYLAKVLADADHAVTVTESDPRLARELGESLDALVLEGDGTSIELLKAAEAGRTDWLVAVTGQDEINLVACELGLTLGAKRVLGRLNDSRNRTTFDAMGIPVVAVTDLIVTLITREVDVVDLERIAVLGRGQVSLIEIEIPEEAPHRRVSDFSLPGQTILVSLTRPNGRLIVPQGETMVMPGDRVMVVTRMQQESEVRAALCRLEDEGGDA